VNTAQRVITILAVPYEQPTKVEYRGELWREVFSRGSFNGFDPAAPNARSVPVSAVLKAPAYSHEGAALVGRVISADTSHPDGLLLDTKIAKTPAGDEMLTLANDGCLHPSIGYVSKDADTQSDRRTMTRRVNRAFLDHLTYVPTPAYDGARVLGVR
jgi:phage head maturation protease